MRIEMSGVGAALVLGLSVACGGAAGDDSEGIAADGSGSASNASGNSTNDSGGVSSNGGPVAGSGGSSQSGFGSGSGGAQGGTNGSYCDCDPISESSVTQPLDCGCGEYCGSTAEQVLADLLQQCGNGAEISIQSGCGVRSVSVGPWFLRVIYYFDESTGVLTGVKRESDTFHGSCNVHRYHYGAVPSSECDSATVCDPCAALGAGGAGGEGSLGGCD